MRDRGGSVLACRGLAAHLVPALAYLVRVGGSGGADLLNRDRRHQVAEAGGLGQRRAGGDGAGDAGAGAVAGADDVNGAGDGISRDKDRHASITVWIGDENAL